MARGYEVLGMLIPEGGWELTGETYEGIQFLECEPITKKAFEAGFAKFDAWKAQQDAAKASAKEVILERIGLTAEELKTILE